MNDYDTDSSYYGFDPTLACVCDDCTGPTDHDRDNDLDEEGKGA